MKTTLLTVAALTLTAISSYAQIADRQEIAPGMYGITHTENFEYVCSMTVVEPNDTYETKVWLDTDFSSAQSHRVAVGFPHNLSMGGMVAAEASVESISLGRCPGVCVSILAKGYDDENAKLRFEFTTDQISKEVKLKTVDLSTGEEKSASCVPNEPI